MARRRSHPSGIEECYDCGSECYSSDAHFEEIEVESGRSSGSVSSSFRHGTRSNSQTIRVNPGRIYYKRITVAICPDCMRQRTRDEAAKERARVRNWRLFFFAIWSYFLYKQYLISFNDAWHMVWITAVFLATIWLFKEFFKICGREFTNLSNKIKGLFKT